MAKNSERFDIFYVQKRNKEAEKGFWHRIGTGFQNKDGSFSLVFDLIPAAIVDSEGRQNLCMRKHVEREDDM